VSTERREVDTGLRQGVAGVAQGFGSLVTRSGRGIPARPSLSPSAFSLGDRTGIVPGLQPHPVQRLGGPGHDVEGIGAADRVRAPLAHDGRDPVGGIGCDVRDLGAAFGAEGVEELGQRRPVPTWCRPDEPAGIVIDHHRQVAVPTLVRDLIDPDPAQPSQPIEVGIDVGGDPSDDRPDRAPGDPHQFRHGGL
jgi:hypothetical protein